MYAITLIPELCVIIFYLSYTHGYPAGLEAATPYIVGGSPVTPYSIPWQVYTEGPNQQSCGGTLISNRHVLTAAHCGDRDFATVGKHSLDDTSDGIRHKVCKTSLHPEWNEWTKDFDFAILHLEKPVEFGPRVTPACLPARRFDGGWDGLDWMQTGKKMTVSGWGQFTYDNYKTPSKLHGVKVPGVTNERCREMFKDFPIKITSNMLCAGDAENGGVDSCRGDSGGPLTYEIDGETTVVGVVSWGYKCAKAGTPGVYARVTSAMPFIHKELSETCSGTTETLNACGKTFSKMLK